MKTLPLSAIGRLAILAYLDEDDSACRILPVRAAI